jgi:hypothetical protein
MNLKMASAESGGANLDYANQIQLSLAQPIGTRDNYLMLNCWLLLMLALNQKESSPSLCPYLPSSFYCIILSYLHSTLPL